MYILYFIIFLGFCYGVWKLIDKYLTVEKVKKAKDDIDGKISVVKESRDLIRKKRELIREKELLSKDKKLHDLEEELSDKE